VKEELKKSKKHVPPKRRCQHPEGYSPINRHRENLQTHKLSCVCVFAITQVTLRVRANSEINPSYTGPSFRSSQLFIFAQYFVWRKPQAHRIQHENQHNGHVTSFRNLLLLNHSYSTLLYTSWSRT